MPCPHLEWRDAARGETFPHDRPYCAVADEPVQPMRADICRERYGLEPVEHCEIFREDAGLEG